MNDLGPCEIDSDGWDADHPTYNFDDTRLFFGCQSEPTETWHVFGFDNIILSDEDAYDAAAVATSEFSGALSTWSFDAIEASGPPQLEDEESAILAEAGAADTEGWIASKWSIVNLEGTDVECEITVYAQQRQANGSSTNLTWSLDGAPNTFHLNSALLHEIGHCTGLGHPNSPANYPSSIMNDLGPGEVVTQLATIDIDALLYLYEPLASTGTDPGTTPP